MQKKLLKKVSVVGDVSVGKTSLIRRYVHNIFDDKYLKTIGTKISKKIINIDDTELTLLVWDIAGEEICEGDKTFYSRGSVSAFVVFDLTRRDTFNHLECWINALFSTSGKIPFIILANKNDLENKEIGLKEIEGLAKEYDTEYFLTSAKTGENVENAFDCMVKKIMK